jgi:hypothetical protein
MTMPEPTPGIFPGYNLAEESAFSLISSFFFLEMVKLKKCGIAMPIISLRYGYSNGKIFKMEG